MAGPLRILVLADTHVRPGGARRLPDAVSALAEDADRILHAGDVVTRDLLDELSGFAPVDAVLGNNDGALVGILPETAALDLDGVRVAMVHDSGPTRGRARRMRRRFPDAHVVVFGHSHQPVDEPGVDGQRLFNPGSPTERRRATAHTVGLLEVADGVLTRRAIVAV